MPADYKATAADLSLSTSPAVIDKTLSASAAAFQLGSMDSGAGAAPFRDDENQDPVESGSNADAPPTASAPTQSTQSVPWARGTSNNNNNTTTSNTRMSTGRRLSAPYSLPLRSSLPLDLRSQLADIAHSILATLQTLYRRGTAFFAALPPTQQVSLLAAGAVVLALMLTLLVFSQRIFTLLGPVAKSWRALPGGWLLIWAATVLVAFPPLMGYSTACTVAGFVYGFPLGWPIVASATVAGSTAAFLASRTVLATYVDRLVGADRRFVALGQVLRHDGLGVLALVRFCPLPYSLSNGFLATVPSVAPAGFALATAAASPKLLVHVFVGSRLALLAEQGARMRLRDRLVNYASMLAGAGVGMGVGIFIYRRTMARAAELTREEGGPGAQLLLVGGGGGGGEDYIDDEDAEGARLMMDPNDAAALMADEDDINLWDAAGDEAWNDADGPPQVGGGYRDEEEAVGGDGAGTKRGGGEE